MADDREPNEEAPTAPGDLPWPVEADQAGGVGADPAEDEDDAKSSAAPTSAGGGFEATASASASGSASAGVNPYPFRHSSTPMNKPFSGRALRFGNDAAKVGGRTFDEAFRDEQAQQ